MKAVSLEEIERVRTHYSIKSVSTAPFCFEDLELSCFVLNPETHSNVKNFVFAILPYVKGERRLRVRKNKDLLLRGIYGISADVPEDFRDLFLFYELFGGAQLGLEGPNALANELALAMKRFNSQRINEYVKARREFFKTFGNSDLFKRSLSEREFRNYEETVIFVEKGISENSQILPRIQDLSNSEAYGRKKICVRKDLNAITKPYEFSLW